MTEGTRLLQREKTLKGTFLVLGCMPTYLDIFTEGVVYVTQVERKKTSGMISEIIRFNKLKNIIL